MGLIILASIACGLAILLGIEFIKSLRSDSLSLALDDPESGRLWIFCLRNRQAFTMAGFAWVICWVLISAYALFEFFSHSEVYF